MNENLVFCRRLNREMPKMLEAPLKGSIGQIILDNVSKEAFEEWLEVQIKIINEERLDLSDTNAQERLYGQMISYLNLSDLVE